MSRKVAFVNDMILKTLNQHQQTVSPDVKKAANLDDDISEVLKRRDVNVYDKVKYFSSIYMLRKLYILLKLHLQLLSIQNHRHHFTVMIPL